MHANEREEIKEVRAGDIAAAVGLKDVTTGDTLCDPETSITLEKMEFPEPVISVAGRAEDQGRPGEDGLALQRLAKEDPSFRVSTDEESGQTIISGMGELHLEIIVDRMKREFKVEANVGKPQVAYRETIRGKVEQEGKFVRQSGGRGQYGHVWLKIEPQREGKGYEFVNGIVGGVVPSEYIPAVDKGIKEALEGGVHRRLPGRRRQGHAVRRLVPRRRLERNGVQDRRLDGVQGRRAQGEARAARADHEGRGRDAGGLLGDVIGDLNRRRGQIQGMDDSVSGKVVTAEVPLAEMFGYATSVRSMSQGRATFTMEFAKYMEVPNNVAEAVMKQEVIACFDDPSRIASDNSTRNLEVFRHG